MYAVNHLERNVLITGEEVIFHGPTKHQLDIRMIESSIIVAEERFIRDALGYDFYETIATAKNTVVTAANIGTLQAKMGDQVIAEGNIVNAYELLPEPLQALWKQHLWKLVSECVITASYPEGFVQLGSEGATHNNPPAGLMVTSGFVTPLLSSMKWSVDKKVKDRISPLLTSMHNYICKNIALYPQYKKPCPECIDGKQTRNVGIALDLYDDEDERKCKKKGWR